MAQRSYLWPTTGTGDGPSGGYPYTQVAEMMSSLYASGVLWGLGVSISGFNAVVSAGSAMIQGIAYTNDAALSLAVSNPGSGNTRRDLVVLRGDASARTVRAVVKAGTVNSGVYPTLQQDASYPASGIYELQLARLIATSTGLALDGGVSMAAPRGIVGAAQIADGAVTATKLGDGAVTTAKLSDGAVTTAKLANQSVNSDKAGDRVPVLIARQGGHATEWWSNGETNYTPGRVVMQCGLTTVTFATPSGSKYYGSTTVYYPQSFAASPLVLVSGAVTAAFGVLNAYSNRVEIGGFEEMNITRFIAWLAIGPV